MRPLASWVLPLLLISPGALADASDFARGRVLDTAADAVVQRVTLPDDVYEWVTRDDLGDLRIFNRRQEEVPYRIRRPVGTEEYSPWQAYPLFVLPEGTGELSSDPRLEIQLDELGSIVAYTGSGETGSGNRSYLVDVNQAGRAPAQLRLVRAGGGEGDFVGRVRIEISNDLDEWEILVAATTIASLSRAQQAVVLDRIDIPPRRARYIRISQVDGNAPLDLERVDVRYRDRTVPERRWKTLPGKRVGESFEFASGGHFPVSRLRVAASGGGSYLVTVQLRARSDPEHPWSDRGVHTFYRTEIDGATAAAKAVPAGQYDRYWRVEFRGEGLPSPVLEIGWLPDEVVFLRQGPAPYVLAYGQAGVTARMWPLQQLLGQLDGSGGNVDLADVPFARAGDPRMLGGPDRLLPPEAPVDWQTIVLWAVLVLGVLLVGVLAFRLLRAGSPP